MVGISEKKEASGMLEKWDSLIHYKWNKLITRNGGKSEQLTQTCPITQAVPEFFRIL